MPGEKEKKKEDVPPLPPPFLSHCLGTHNDLADRLAAGQAVQEGGLAAAGGAHLWREKGTR